MNYKYTQRLLAKATCFTALTNCSTEGDGMHNLMAPVCIRKAFFSGRKSWIPPSFLLYTFNPSNKPWGYINKLRIDQQVQHESMLYDQLIWSLGVLSTYLSIVQDPRRRVKVYVSIAGNNSIWKLLFARAFHYIHVIRLSKTKSKCIPVDVGIVSIPAADFKQQYIRIRKQQKVINAANFEGTKATVKPQLN